MAQDPSCKQIIQEIVTTLLREREVVVFLGAGSSQEGRQGDHPFPAFFDLVDQVLADAGTQPTSKDDRLSLFQEVVDRWYAQRQSLSAAFEDYLYGEPGFPHYLLAALSLSLFPDSRFLLYLTTNYDDLMARAFRDLERVKEKTKTVTLSLPYRPTGKETQHLFGAIAAHIRNGRPVILKIFGDLDAQPPVFKTDGVHLEPEVEASLEALLKGPVIFIGYSFSDSLIVELILRSRGRAPIFIVTPQQRLPEFIQRNCRARHLRQTFSEFMTSLLAPLHDRSPAITEKVDKLLSLLDPTLFYTSADAIRFRAQEASRISLLRSRERLPTHGQELESERVLISRVDSQPDIDSFLRGDRPLLAITGDSGTGKSTLLFQLYKELSSHESACIPLFYDVYQIQPRRSLSAQLAYDFRCEESQLHSLIESFEKVLTAKRQKLVLIVDALNESSPILPSVLKSDIEGLAERFTGSIKLIYTCRRIYWETHLAGHVTLPSRLYFGAREQVLGKFSMREALIAFQSYQRLYEFRGTFEALRKELQERLCDPLMLRMLAEGYQGKKVPEFAPAVLIFDSYFDRLRQRFRGTKLLHFLERLVDTKIHAFQQGNVVTTDLFCADDLLQDPVLHNLTVQQNSSTKMPGDPCVLLEDEGILATLDSEGSRLKFSYDRFYEYLLGRGLGRFLQQMDAAGFILWFREQALASYCQHISFLEALKSEVVRRNISEPGGPWSLYLPSTMEALLNDPDPRVRSVLKDLIRELTFEGTGDTLAVLKRIARSEEAWQLLALDVASDSPKVMPVLVKALLSGNQTLMRRSIHHLSYEERDSSFREDFESVLLDVIAAQDLDRSLSRGLIYYTAVILSLEDRLGRDSLLAARDFWERVLSNQVDLKASLSILGEELACLIESEAPFFFSAEARLTPIDYLWAEFGSSERALTSELINALVEPGKPLTRKQKAVIRFFGSELRYWHLRKAPEKNPVYAYPFEFHIAEWLLIARAESNFREVLTILEEFVATGFWLSIDFALCNMEFILRHVHPGNPMIITQGFEAMKGWTRVFRETQSDRFFATLREKDPFSVNYIPIAQLAAVDLTFNTPEDGPISVLLDELESGDSDRARLALLSTRYLWRESPRRALATLRVFVGSSDPVIAEWVNRVLKEVFLVYPRLVEEFFRLNRFTIDRVRQIKDRADVEDAVGFRHDGDPLFKSLFLQGNERRAEIAYWYERLLRSGSFQSFCRELVATLAKRLSIPGPEWRDKEDRGGDRFFSTASTREIQ